LTGSYTCNGTLSIGYYLSNVNVLNNTFTMYNGVTCHSVTGVACTAIGDAGPGITSITIKNNVTTGGNYNMYLPHGGTSSIAAIDYNDYYGWDSAFGGWTIASGTYSQTFASWQACTTNCLTSGSPDVHGTQGNPTLSPAFAPQSGSAAIGIGTNLYSVCNGQPNPGLGALCNDAAGNA